MKDVGEMDPCFIRGRSERRKNRNDVSFHSLRQELWKKLNGEGRTSSKKKNEKTKAQIEERLVRGEMEEGEPSFGRDLAIFQILCRQMLVGQRGIVRGVCEVGERRCHWNGRHHRAE